MRHIYLLIPVFAIAVSACIPGRTQTTTQASPTPTVTESPSASSTPTASAGGQVNSQGVMVGGTLMTADKNLFQNAQNADNLTTVVEAVKQAGLAETLQNPGPFTVFAPTNQAFEKLPAKTRTDLLKPENKAQLVKLLTYHVVPGKLTTADFKDDLKLKTVQGQELTINKNGSTWQIIDANDNTATIETVDVLATNGVAFIIQSVLMPR